MYSIFVRYRITVYLWRDKVTCSKHISGDCRLLFEWEDHLPRPLSEFEM